MAATALVTAGAPLFSDPAQAVEVPNGDYTQAFSIQTNGPQGAIGLGDWYSASTAQGGGGQQHQLKLNVPCSWPSTTPIYLDLYSAAINTATTGYVGNQTYEEPNGTADTTSFTLNSPTGALVRTTSYPPINSTTDSWTRFATLTSPVACGTYTLLDSTTGDDQNGWKLRFGTDNNTDPNDAPPANYDNPDGKTGTDDELTVGLQQISYQHDLGDGTPATAKCLTLYEYVNPGLASVTFNNFDMDGANLTGSGVRYYAPSAAFDPTGQAGGIVGTVSQNAGWNGGSVSARGGDTVTNPEPGWWKIVTCINNHNQFIQEGQAGQPAYLTQPPTPRLQVTKDDGNAFVDPGQRVTYTVTVANTATGNTAGAATSVVSKDTLPAGLTPVSCAITGATTGETCAFAGQVATATFKGAIAAGTNRQFTVVADVVSTGTPASFLNSVSTTYSDSIGNAYVPVTATDTDQRSSADLSVTKTHTGSFTVGATNTYTLTATNAAGSVSRARGVTIVDTLPSGLTYLSGTGTGWTCIPAGQTVTCTYAPDLAPGASAAVTLSVSTLAGAFPSTTNTATVSSSTPDPTAGNNTASDVTAVTGATVGDRVFADTNGNGIQDTGETGVANVTVRLLSSTGTVLQTTTTNGTGAYSFTGLVGGAYSVQFVAPTGQVFTVVDAGTDDTADSDASRTTGTSPPFTLANGGSNTTVDAGLVPPATIGDLVYNDLDGSGVQNGSEPGLSGVVVTLSQNGTQVATTTTNASGAYSFPNLTAGTYVVTVTTPTGFTGTGPRTSPRTVLLGVGQNDTTEDFGYLQTNATLGDTVYNDLNGNGKQDAGEPGVQGVRLTLLKNGVSQGFVDSAANGTYSFSGLAAGSYTVQASNLPTGFSLTTTNPFPVALAAGQLVDTADFGIRQTNATIGDTVYVDADADGVQDPGEVGLNGVTVTLYDSTGTTQIGSPTTTATVGGVAGRYSFANLPGGTYVVKLTTPTGYLATTSTSVTRTVAPGGTADDADFGVQAAQGSIGDTVYNDLNGNNTQDAGEPGLGNRVVTLTRGGTTVGTATTDANGTYLFSGLPAGTYVVSVPTPNNFSPTGPATSPLTVNLGATEAYTTADFGFWQTNGSIGDLVYNDLNGNGSIDAGEPGLANVPVQLSRNGVAGYRTTTTDANGAYSFGTLPAGNYVVTVTVPASFGVTTTPYGVPVTLDVGQTVTTADVGLVQNNGRIGDTVFDDLNGNGTQDAGEPGLAGVTVTLTKGGVTLTTSTDANGAYLFTGLVAGSYSLNVTGGVPAGYTATTGGRPRTIALTAGQQDLGEDLGYRQTNASIGDLVFNDLNGNGLQDAGEPGLGSRLVTLKLNGTTVTTTTTAADGTYLFTGLPAGTYTVEVATPGGFVVSTGAQSVASPATVVLGAGQAYRTADFGFLQSNAVLGDTVYVDTNGNGVQDAGETGYAGATVTVLYAGPDGDFTTAGDNATFTRTTSATGTYSVTGLRAGSYRATVTVPTGYSVTTTNPLTVGIVAGQNLDTVDFGLRRTDGALTGTVYDDADGSQTQGSGETGLSGLTVTLRQVTGGGSLVRTTTTATDGSYAFTGLPAGTYTTEITVPSGRQATTPNPTTARTVTAGATTPNVDIGTRRFDASIAGTTFVEPGPGNGSLDSGEPGLSGVPVTLKQGAAADCTGGTVVASTTSGTSGAFAFTGLPAGSYQLCYTAPSASYVRTTGSPVGGVPVTLTAGQASSGNNLGLTLTNGSIGDTVFNDVNGNGQQDAGDAGIAGAAVGLVGAGADNTFGTGDDLTRSTTTDASGLYAFTGLTGGLYRVTVTPLAAYGPSTTGGNTINVTLPDGGAVTTADFGYQAPNAALGDTVFDDVNGDGIQQPGEPGLGGVPVALVDYGPDGVLGGGDDTVLPGTTTASDGSYAFTGLAAGTYGVTVTVVSGRYASTPVTVVRTLGSKTVANDVDFGLTALGSIGDRVFDDKDGSGTDNTGDAGLAGATVTVTGGPDAVTVTSAATGSTGAYAVTGLKLGTYTVTVSLPTGYAATTVTSYTTTLTPTGRTVDTDDFGAQLQASTVNGTVYNELDGTTGKGTGDPGLAGATVTLTRGTTTVATQTTGSGGTYAFTGLPAGSYTVTVTPPTGFTGIAPTSQTAVLDGTNTVTRDFAEQQTNASIGQTVYVDTNANGTQDTAEVGLNGVTVKLYAGATTTGPVLDTKVTATTTVDGRYLFSGLAAGQYTVAITVPPGYTATTPTTQTLTIAAGQNVRVVNFGVRTVGVTGTVYNDVANDGQTTGDAGLPGATVSIVVGGTTLTTTTDANGRYAFNGVAPGDYQVTVTVPAGYQASRPTTVTATVTANAGASNVDFALAPKTGAIGDLVFNDTAGDGSPSGDAGLLGGTVTVTQTVGGVTTTYGTATSAADGSYLVSGLAAGTYTATFTPPSGFATTTASSRTVVVTAGATNGTADFGARQANASLGDEVYVDTNGNGRRDTGEPLYTASTLTLTLSGTSTGSTTTSTGTYLFSNLPAGTYSVGLTAPTGYRLTQTVSGLALANGQNIRIADLGLEPIPGALSGNVFSDTDASGTKDAGEANVVGQTVTVSRGGTTVATLTTDASGNYSLTGLPLGTYTVSVTGPIGTAPSTPSTRTVTLTSGAPVSAGNDFGLAPATGSIGDTVFTDLDGSGTQNGGEPGYSGATVTLTKGTLTRTALTAADGTYSFTGLTAGQYTVTVTVPAGTRATGTGPSTTVTLGAGSAVDTADFGLQQVDSSLAGTVFDDPNADQVRQTGEVGLAGVTVQLSGGPTSKPATTTAANGTYSFGTLAPGTYTVTFSPPAGSTATTPTTRTVTVPASTAVTGVDFAARTTSGSVGGPVFSDTNGNGTDDGTVDPALPGVTVTLSSGGTPVAMVTSAPNGSYSFPNLPAGTYTVTATTPAGYTATTPVSGVVTVGTGPVAGPLFGFQPVDASLSGVVFNDPSADGAQQTGETGYAGATVTLLRGTTPVDTTTSAADGTFSFTGLAAGDYTVRLTLPTGYVATSPVTVASTVAPSAQVTGVTFGVLESDGALAGTVYDDRDGSASLGAGEPGRTGVTVTLVRGGTTVATTTTDANGEYLFTGLRAGTYDVVLTTPTGATSTTPATVTQPLTAGQQVDNVDFGLGVASIGDTVYDDANGNGVQDTGEAGLTGVVVTLRQGTTTQGAVLGSVQTGTGGSYVFDSLLAGTYTVTVSVPAGRQPTTPATRTVTVAAAQDVTTADFGLQVIPNSPPTYTAAPTNTAQTVAVGQGLAPLAAVDPNGDALTYAVTAGTLPPGITLNPDGTFSGTTTTVGQTSVTVRVSDGNGGTATTTLVVTVTGNSPPAFTTAPTNDAQTVTVGGTPVPLQATDPNGDPLTYTVTAGTLPAGLTLNPNGTFSGTATTPGTRTVTVTVADGKGGTDTTQLTITVTAAPDRAPLANDDTATTPAGTPVTTSVLTNDTDPDNDPLTVSANTQPANGTVTCTTTTCTYTPRAGFTGTDTYTYTASDGRGLSDTATVTVTVTAPANNPPAFSNTPNNTSQTIAVGQTPLPVTATDPDGDPLTYTVTAGSLPPGLTLNPDGTFSGTATTPGGPTTVTITVSDGRGGNDSTALAVTITVTPAPNTPPVANTDSATTTASTPVTTSVLANDTDADGDTLAVAGFTQPASGSVTCTATACTYTPAAGFTGVDSYTYTVSDGKGGTDTATVTVTVPNSPPAYDGSSGNTAQTVPTGGTPVPLSASDPDGDPLTYAVTGGTLPAGITLNPDGTFSGTATTPGTTTVTIRVSDGNGGTDTTTVTFTVTATPDRAPVANDDTVTTTAGTPVATPVTVNDTDPDGDPLTVQSVTQPAHGTVTCDNVLTASHPAPTCTYTPAAGYTGPDSYTYVVSDGRGKTDTATVTVTVTATPNRAPQFTAAATNDAQPLAVGGTPVPLQATDADGDPLTYAVTSGTLPAGITLNADGTFSGTATTPGTRTVTVTVSDGRGGTDTTVLTLTVSATAQPPVAGDDTITTPGGAPITFDPRANDTDPKGTALTVTGSTQPAHGTVSCTTTACTYTPTAGYAGPDSFTYTITNAAGLTDTATVTVTVSNTAPQFTSATTNDSQSTGLGRGLVPLAATDANGDPLTYTVTGGTLPAGITLNADGTFSGTATTSGQTTATITVADGKGGTDTTTLVVTVAANQPPVFSPATGNTSQTIPVGGTPVPVTATDPDPGQTPTYTVTGGSLPAGVTLGSDGTFGGAATTPGTTTVTITATDPNGATATTSLTITVTPAPDRAPVATDDTATVTAGGTVTTNVLTNDTDPDGDTLTVQTVTQPAHGTVTCTTTAGVTACTYVPDAGYSGPDSYDYVVSDGKGLTDTGTVTVTVTAAANRPPVFDSTPNNTSQTIVVGQTPAPLTASDPDGDPLTFTVTTGTLPPGITLNPDGTFSGTATTAGGPTTVTITVSDGRGGNDSTDLSVTITVTAAPGATPVANPDTATTPTDAPVTTNVLANDTDADAGDTLTVVSHTDPAHGTVTCTTTACTYVPDTGYAGPDSYTYVVSDAAGHTATGTVSVTVQNAPPVFDGSSGNTAQTVPVGTTPTPLSATDANGDRLTYTVTAGTLPAGVTLNADGTFSGTATTPGTRTVTVTVSDGKGGTATTQLVFTVVPAINRPPVADDETAATSGAPVVVPVLAGDTDPDGDTLTVASFTQPAHGTVTCTATGSCTYTPTAGYAGPDSFTYVVSDGKGGTDTGTVTLTVTAPNRPPVANPNSATTTEDTPIVLSPLGNDTDPDGDPLAFVSVTQPAHGKVTCTTAGVCTYTPAANYFGPDAFTYVVSDGKGGTATGTVTLTVTPVDDAPVARADRATTPSGTPVKINVAGNDTDVEGDALAVTVATQPRHGTVSCTTAGVCTYTPDAGFTGNDGFTYSVSDGKGGTTLGSVTVTVTNRAPTAVPDAITVFPATPSTIPVLANDTDPDGDRLTLVSSTQPVHGTVTCTAAGVCTYTSDAGYGGPDAFTYTVSDGKGHTSTTTVRVTVDNTSGGGGGSGVGSGGGATGGGSTGGGSAGGGTGQIPFTGAEVQHHLQWALTLLGAGLLLLLAGRRRRA